MKESGRSRARLMTAIARPLGASATSAYPQAAMVSVPNNRIARPSGTAVGDRRTSKNATPAAKTSTPVIPAIHSTDEVRPAR